MQNQRTVMSPKIFVSRPKRTSPMVPPKQQKPKPRTTAVRSLVRFFLLVVSNLASNAIIFSFSFGSSFGELGSVSKRLDAWWEVGGLVAWRAIELGLAWYLDLDARDALSFFTITNFPTFSLLSTFYGIRPTTILVSYAASVLSPAIPLFLLRASTSVHNSSRAAQSENSIPNRSILQDGPTSICTTFVASAILSLSAYISYATWLPTHLVVHFEGIPDISAVHTGPEALPCLFLILLLPGWLAHDFLFVSSTGAPSEVSSGVVPANRKGEYLAASVYRRTWGALSAKTRILLVRTVFLAGMIVLNTIVQVAGTVKGVHVEGAAGWGALWGLGTLVTGLAFGWIQGVEGV